MEKSGTGRMRDVHYAYGSVIEMEDKECESYIIPESVKLTFHGEPLFPTQFDAHGNPQISGVANLMLIWKTRRMVRSGKISSQYDIIVDYSYEVVSHPIEVSIVQRLPRADICPICSKPFTSSELDQGQAVTLDQYHAVVHRSCAKEFYAARRIDEYIESAKAPVYSMELYS